MPIIVDTVSPAHTLAHNAQDPLNIALVVPTLLQFCKEFAISNALSTTIKIILGFVCVVNCLALHVWDKLATVLNVLEKGIIYTMGNA